MLVTVLGNGADSDVLVYPGPKHGYGNLRFLALHGYPKTLLTLVMQITNHAVKPI